MGKDETADKVRENRLRRAAARQGLSLVRSRRRDPRALDYGGYMLVSLANNQIVLGASPSAFNATIDDIEGYLNQPD